MQIDNCSHRERVRSQLCAVIGGGIIIGFSVRRAIILHPGAGESGRHTIHILIFMEVIVVDRIGVGVGYQGRGLSGRRERQFDIEGLCFLNSR